MLRRLFRVSLRRSHDIVSETDEEIRFHIAARVDRLMADGMSRDAAEAEAWRLFGPSESRAIVIAAAQRREETLSMFERFDAIRSDVWYALRQLRRAPLFTAAAVASLAIGIGANAMMFGVIDRLLLRQRPGVVAPEQIFSIGEMRHSGRGEYRTTTFSYPTYKDYRDLESLEQIAVAAGPGDMSLGRGSNAAKIRGTLVSASYLPLTGVRPLLGRFIQPDEDREPTGTPVVVVTYGYWQREMGGSASVLGRTLDIGPRRYTIVGVTPKHFTGLQQGPVDVFIPITAAEGLRFAGPRWATHRGSSWLQVYARLKPGVSVAQAEGRGTLITRANVRPGGDSLARLSLQSIVPRSDTKPSTTVLVSRLLAAVSVLVLL
ncbi:MAG TPA: ABC transporter permease, partial [Gemmatimonadaceae bacterium]